MEGLEKSELIDLILNQAERLDKLEREVERLRGELTTALRSNKRQAAPFGKVKKEQAKPRRSGRKKGHKGTYRRPSAEPNEEAESPLDCCPRCGGEVQEVEPVDQIIEEIPPVQPRIVRLCLANPLVSGGFRGNQELRNQELRTIPQKLRTAPPSRLHRPESRKIEHIRGYQTNIH